MEIPIKSIKMDDLGVPPFSETPIYPSLKLTAKAPENGWLEDDPFLLGKPAYFQVPC